MDVDLREALTHGFGAEPSHRPVADRLEAGHRAVRRRRIAGAVLAVAVASAVVVGTVTLSGGSGTPNGVATDPTTSTTTAAASPRAELAYYEDDGTLVIDPEALVVTRIENPLHLQPPDQSVALDLRDGGDERWALLKIQFDREGSLGSVGSFDTPSADFADFADWVAVRATDEPAATRGDDYLPKIPVRFGEGVELVPVDGVRIVLQRPNPDLPANFAPAGSRTAVALVEGPDGRREWVLARDVDGFDVIAFPTSRANENVGEFLEFAREQYSGGAGLPASTPSRDAAFADFVAAKQTQLRRVAYALCGEWHRAEDLMQTAFIKLYVAWPRLRDPDAAEAYTRRILVRANIDESRRPWRRERTSVDGHDRPAETAPAYEERSALVEALQRLPAMQRKVVVLRHMIGLSVAEAADELGISQGTVKSHTSRGLAALEKALLATDKH